MSDEDLLSNVDRISKILPTNEISEEDDNLLMLDDGPRTSKTALIQKLKEQR